MSVLLGPLLLACETSSAPAPAPTRSAWVHPEFPVRPSPEMIAQSNIGMEAEARRAAAVAEPPPPKNWNASCLMHRACPFKEQAVPTCETGKGAARWSELQLQADSLLGKTVDVKGGLGLAPIQGTSNQTTKCAADSCCHALRMAITIDGDPIALPLVGLSCAGDDSKLCCSVPANGQTVIAHGRLAKAPGKGLSKWQLEDVTLCEPEAPQPPDH
ncbi:MAG: hypothetical protein ABW061_14395 [Polyangiaceae bacterium]